MKKILFALLLLAGFVVNAQENKSIVYDENAQQRKVPSFTAISVSSAIDLYLTQSNKNEVAVSATNDEIRDHIITEVVGGTLIIRLGDKNQRIKSFKFIENSSNPVDRSSVVLQFEEIANLDVVENKEIRQFFRDLALYATFQSGYNFGEFSYTSVTPVDLINRLYGIY